jgi:hypothetical protein
MADDKHFVMGDFYRICDQTGFKIRANRTKKQWNNYIVREQSFELRQPQDFVRGVRDDQTVPEPRPRQTNVFLENQTTVAGGGSAYIPALGYAVDVGYPPGSNAIGVANITIFNIGDSISIMQDDGTYLFATVLGYAEAFNLDFNDDFDRTGGIQLSKPLTFFVSIGNVVNDLTYSPITAASLPSTIT